jgi:hypothetical protein
MSQRIQPNTILRSSDSDTNAYSINVTMTSPSPDTNSASSQDATRLTKPISLSNPKSVHKSCSIEDLRSNSILWYKLHVFMYDLRNFRSNADARNRLDCVVAEHYVGEPYFTSIEADKVLHTVTDAATGGTLSDVINQFFTQKLARRLDGRIKEKGDYCICAAHDLAPLFEKAFRLNGKDLAKNKAFTALVGKGGLRALDQGGVWKGVGRR